MRLTKEQRAKRNASRKNNRLKSKYPLFADQLGEMGWLTTPEDELQRITEAENRAKTHFAKMKQWDKEAYQLGVLRKNVLMGIVGSERVDELERLLKRRTPHVDGAYYADFWWQQIKRFAPTEVKARYCPNKHFHTWEMYEECPTCGVRINVKAEIQRELLKTG